MFGRTTCFFYINNDGSRRRGTAGPGDGRVMIYARRVVALFGVDDRLGKGLRFVLYGEDGWEEYGGSDVRSVRTRCFLLSWLLIRRWLWTGNKVPF